MRKRRENERRLWRKKTYIIKAGRRDQRKRIQGRRLTKEKKKMQGNGRDKANGKERRDYGNGNH